MASPIAGRPRHSGHTPAILASLRSVNQDVDADSDERKDRYQRAAAAAGGAAIGAIVAGPAGAIVGAGLGPLLEPVAQKIWQELSGDARRRASEVLASACEASGRSAQDVEELISSSERTRLLAGIAMTTGTRTSWNDKVRTLGRSLASGLLAEDDARIDTEQLVLAAIADIEAPHLSLLDLLVSYEPGRTIGGPAFQKALHQSRRTWDVAQICRARPPLAPVVGSLLGTLQRHGLVAQNDNVADALANYSRDVSAEFQRFHQESRNKNANVPRRLSMRPLDPMGARRLAPEPTWSPTELGDLVHSRFTEAGAGVPDKWLTAPQGSSGN